MTLFRLTLTFAVVIALASGTLFAQTGSLVWQSDLDGNANDNVGSFNFTANGGPSATADRFGNAGAATSFNGSSQNFTGALGSAPVSTFTAGSLSIWARGSDGGAGDDGAINIGGHGGGGIDYFGLLRSNPGSDPYRADIDNGTTRNSAEESPATDTTTWHMVSMTWEGSGTGGFVNIYVDGVLEATAAATIPSVTPDNDWVVGSYQTANLYWDGELDDAAVWDTALSGEEVAGLYALSNDIDLQYNAQDGDILIDLFRDGGGTATVSDGTVWEYATGLSGNVGDLVFVPGTQGVGLILDNSGNGVQQAAVPEPTSIAIWGILGAALFGFAYRRYHQKK